MIARALVAAVVVACSALSWSTAASADESDTALGLPEVLASAERSFPLLKAAELERAIAGGDLLSAEGGFDVSWKARGTITPVGYYDSTRAETVVELPTPVWGSSVFAGWRVGRGSFPVYEGKQETLDYGELRAGINVPLWRNGPIDRRRANIGKAELGKDVAALTVAQQRLEIMRSASTRYWAWRAAGRRVAIAKALLKIVAERDAGLSFRVERGDLPPYERDDNRRAIEQRTAQLAVAERGLEQAAIELSLFYRDGDGRPRLAPATRLPPELPGPAPSARPMGEDLAAAVVRRPEARRLELQLKQTRIELDWARNQLALGLDLQLAGSQDIGPARATRPDLSKPVFEATLLLDIPLQTRTIRGRIDAASATERRLQEQRSFAEDRISADVRDAHSALRLSQLRIESTQREVALARRLEDGERTRFDQGDSHLLIVNLREQQTAEAELREVDALLDYHRAVVDLEAARGGK
jgi:outer membrane protein, heavy metal efflux system